MDHLFLATDTHQHFIVTVTSDVHKIKSLFPSQLIHWVGTMFPHMGLFTYGLIHMTVPLKKNIK